MKQKFRLPLICLGLVVLLMSAMAVASASWSTTFVYTQFGADTVSIDTGSVYSSWSFSITNALTYNATGTHEAKVIFANTTSAVKEGLMLAMKGDGTTKFYYKVGDTDVEIASDSVTILSAGDYFVIAVHGGLLSIEHYVNSTDTLTSLMSDFAFSIDIVAVCAVGGAGTSGTIAVATAGYVNVVYGSGSSAGVGSDMTSTITEWLPTILQFAIIGMIFGMIKKFRA